MELRKLWLATLASTSLAGCLEPADAPPEGNTATATEALNGDSWLTVDDNPYTPGEGARNYGIAISPTTHTAIVVGSRTETDGSTTWLVRSSPNQSGSFVFNSIEKTGPGLSSVATNIAVDPSGTFYVVGTTVTADGATHWVVTRSTNDGGSWTPVFSSAPKTAAEVPTGIVADAFGDVMISGMQIQGGGPTGVILRGTTQGSHWSQVFSHAAIGADGNDIYSLCSGKYGGVPALYGVGWEAYSPSGSDATIYHSIDNGATWAFDYGLGTLSYQRNKFYGCSATSNTDLQAVGGSDEGGDPLLVSSWVDYVEDVANGSTLTHDRVDTGQSSLNAANGAVFVTGPAARDYAVGTKAGSTSARTWHVRYATNTTSSTWFDSDDFKLATGSTAWANAAAYDATRGLFVVGAAYDASGRLHGVIRYRL